MSSLTMHMQGNSLCQYDMFWTPKNRYAVFAASIRNKITTITWPGIDSPLLEDMPSSAF